MTTWKTPLLADAACLAATSLTVLLAGCAPPSGGWAPAEPLPAPVAESQLPTGAEAAPAPEASSARALDSAEADVRAAIARSLPFLAAEGEAWMRGEVSVQDGRGCVSCHHVNYAVWGLQEARRAGVPGPAEATEWLTAAAVEFLGRPDVPRSMILGPLLLGLGHDPAALTEQLLDLQTDSGRWRARGQFPDQRRPVHESDAVATLWSLLVLPSGTDEDARAWQAAEQWLAALEPGVSNEWQIGRALLARRLGHPDEAAAARQALDAAQNEDGGWGWLPGDASNAFSTGQALYALSHFGPPNAAAKRYLLGTQEPEGTWSVPSSAISTQPSGERDVIYRFWGTAWATIGLARSLEPVVPGPSSAAAQVARRDPRRNVAAAGHR